ncbi:helix-turn-helix transcriptional regulator [bacterium]|nr:helix-turn-helix transcriptional regulator [bacterium]
MDIKQIFGKNVKKIRKARGFTQMQFAEIIGVEQKHVSFIESGISFPSAGLISKIADNLEIHPKKLFDSEEPLTLEKLKKNIIQMLDNFNYDEISKIHNYASSLYLDKA